MYTRKIYLSDIILKLILIRGVMDHKDDKVLLYNTRLMIKLGDISIIPATSSVVLQD